MKLNQIDIGNVPSKMWWDSLVRKVNSHDIIAIPPLNITYGEIGSELSIKMPPNTYFGKIEAINSGSGGTSGHWNTTTKWYSWTEMTFNETSGSTNLSIQSGYTHSGFDLVELNNINLRSGTYVLAYRHDGHFICEYPFSEFYARVDSFDSSGSITSGDMSGALWRSGPILFKRQFTSGSGIYNSGILYDFLANSGWLYIPGSGFSGYAYEQNANYRNISGGATGTIVKITETTNDSGYPFYVFENPCGYDVKYVNSGKYGSGASGAMLYWDPDYSRKSNPSNDSRYDAKGQYVLLDIGNSGQFLVVDNGLPKWTDHSGALSGYAYSTEAYTTNSCSIYNLRFDSGGHVRQFSSPDSGFTETWYLIDGTPV